MTVFGCLFLSKDRAKGERAFTKLHKVVSKAVIMRTSFKSPTARGLAFLAGVLSAGALVSVPAIAQDSTSSPQAPAPTYPGGSQVPGTSTTPQTPTKPAAEDPTGADPSMSPTPGSASEVDPATAAPTTANFTILELASGSGSFSTLTQAIEAAELTETLSGDGPYTVFAPTDEAFAELPEGALEYLLKPENKAVLQEVLSYHVAEGTLTSTDISTGMVETLGGGLAVQVEDTGVVVNNASVVQPDVEASNGVIHVVNRVLLPEDLQESLAAALGVDSIY